jgi:pimeloyl-ACP methyl ester carboxylesterase
VPYATNALDGVRTYFEDAGGSAAPVVVYPGLADPLEYAQSLPLVRALAADFRLILADHRGQGRSDKPHDAAAYALATRVGDVVAVLDALGLERAHFLGFSWGARLGFALGEHAPDRVASLALCGNQPYAWDPAWPFVPALSRAANESTERGMIGFVDALESALGTTFPEPIRSWMLANDPAAIRAAWQSALDEGDISRDLTSWRVPCLIYAGTADEMHDNAARAAAEIPGAIFVALDGETHLSGEREANAVLPRVRELFRSAWR